MPLVIYQSIEWVWVLWSEMSHLVCASTEVIYGNLFVYAAEAKVILEGLRICKREGFRRIEVESDALNVIKTIASNNWEFIPEGHIFDEIKSIVTQLEENPRNVQWGGLLSCKGCYS